MPKSILHIKNFNKGIETTTSEEDISPETASHSLNIDPLAQDGKLASIPHDKFLKSTGLTDSSVASDGAITHPSALAVVAEEMSIVNDGKVHNLFFYNSNTKKIEVVKDVYREDTGNFGTTTAVTTLSTDAEQNTDGVVAMQNHNKEVHIGMDDGPTLWAGAIGHDQFGTYQTSDGAVKNANNAYSTILEKAELLNPGLLPML